MQTEIEAKFLGVNHAMLRRKLKALGAECTHPRRLMQRRNYDFPDDHLSKVNGWVRLRNEGDKITLSYKQLNERTLHGTQEVETIVNDFGTANAFLIAIGLVCTGDEETKRESWKLGKVQVELDEWPWIRPFAELEGPSEAAVRAAAQELGLDWHDAVFGSVEIAYQAEYDVTEQEVIRGAFHFGPAPAWLAAKRKNV